MRVGLFWPHHWVGGGGGRTESGFVLKISLADYRCFCVARKPLSNGYPQQWSGCFKGAGDLSITGCIHKEAGSPTARDSWWKVESITLETCFSPPCYLPNISGILPFLPPAMLLPRGRLPSCLVLLISIASQLVSLHAFL